MGKIEHIESLFYITSGMVGNFVTQKQVNACPPLLLKMNYAKAAFDFGFGWQSTPLVGLLAFGKSKSR
jgi:hypothetical protein